MARVPVGHLYFLWVCRRGGGGVGMYWVCRRNEGVEERIWGRDNIGVRGYGGGGWMRINNKIASMECVEHNTTIACNFINEYGI